MFSYKDKTHLGITSLAEASKAEAPAVHVDVASLETDPLAGDYRLS